VRDQETDTSRSFQSRSCLRGMRQACFSGTSASGDQQRKDRWGSRGGSCDLGPLGGNKAILGRRDWDAAMGLPDYSSAILSSRLADSSFSSLFPLDERRQGSSCSTKGPGFSRGPKGVAGVARQFYYWFSDRQRSRTAPQIAVFAAYVSPPRSCVPSDTRAVYFRSQWGLDGIVPTRLQAGVRALRCRLCDQTKSCDEN